MKITKDSLAIIICIAILLLMFLFSVFIDYIFPVPAVLLGK